MALNDDALTLVLKIYGALCVWEYDYHRRSDYTLITYIDSLITEFVEHRFNLPPETNPNEHQK